jgi:hypothetical protein
MSSGNVMESKSGVSEPPSGICEISFVVDTFPSVTLSAVTHEEFVKLRSNGIFGHFPIAIRASETVFEEGTEKCLTIGCTHLALSASELFIEHEEGSPLFFGPSVRSSVCQKKGDSVVIRSRIGGCI